MNVDEYTHFLGQIEGRLRNAKGVLGVVLVGSTADPIHRDEWSDHDFWIIAEDAEIGSYLDSTSWLPESEEILLSGCHSPAYRSVLYRDGHKVDYAVFTTKQALCQGRLGRYRIPVGEESVRKLAEKIQLSTQKAEGAGVVQDELENLSLLAWTAHARGARGEWLSARRWLEAAIDVLLDFLRSGNALEVAAGADALDPRRRLEETDPRFAERLQAPLESDPYRQLVPFWRLPWTGSNPGSQHWHGTWWNP